MQKTVTLYPSRIGCPSIPGTMKGIVSSLPGVENVRVRYAERALDITYNDDKISPDDVIKKIGQELGLRLETEEPLNKDKSVADTCPM